MTPAEPSSPSEEAAAYIQHSVDAMRSEDRDLADSAAIAIGATSAAEFLRTGRLQLDLLHQYGFASTSDLADVGCGSGRLASQLGPAFTGRYLGTDISTELLDYAGARYGGPGRTFRQVSDLTIPASDDSFDFLTMFSVLTHLRHEESYLYLLEARRVIRPGGRIIVSFLDFSQHTHWAVFEQMVNERAAHSPPEYVNQFMSKDALAKWAEFADLELTVVHDGMAPHIVTSDPAAEPLASLGQSIAVFTKPRR